MTKKGIVFIILIVSVISVLVVAVWGTLPENTSQASIEKLEILDFDGFDENGEKIIEINDIVTISNPIYILKYDYAPKEAYGEIKITISNNDVTYQHDPDKKEIYIYYSLPAIEAENAVTITIRDQRAEKKDSITLWFSIPDIIIIPE